MSSSTRPQTLFLLVGPPGAGKSYFARLLDPHKFQVYNRDAQGWSYGDLLEHLFPRPGAPGSRHLVADLCNHLAAKRRRIISKAVKRGMQVVLVSFEVPADIRLARLYNRLARGEPHPSVHDQATALKVHTYFEAKFEPISEAELEGWPPKAVVLIRVNSSTAYGHYAGVFNSRP